MPSDWSKYQNDIRKLYLHDRKPLREVRGLIQVKYGFQASTRAYRAKIVEWGFKKADNADSEATAGLETFSTQNSTQAEISRSLQQQSPLIVHNNVNFSSMTFSELPMFPVDPESPWPNQPVPNTNRTEYPAISVNHDSAPALDLRDAEGRTNLMRAVRAGLDNHVRSLLLDGAAVDAQDNFGDHALHISCRNPGFSDKILSLLMDYGARSDAVGREGKTPLHLSAKSSSRLKILLKGKPDLSVQDDEGNTPLHYACGPFAENEAFELLVNKGADLNITNHARQSPFEKLLEVMKDEEKSPLLLMSLHHGADVNLQDSWGRLPFETFAALCPRNWHSSAYESAKRWVDGAQLFLMKGASPNIKLSSGNLLLHELMKDRSFWSRWKEFGYFVCRKTDPNIRGLEGNTSLHELARSENLQEELKLLALLIKFGADVEATNDEKKSPLLMYVERRNSPYYAIDTTYKAIAALLDAGANPFYTIPSVDMPIYALAKSYTGCDHGSVIIPLKMMLRNATSWESSFPAISTESKWWRKFAEALDRARRCEEIQITSPDLDPRDCLPEDTVNKIRLAADQVIAEEALTALKKELVQIRASEVPAPERLRDICQKIVRVLRGCRDKPIDIDIAWYKFLVDVIEFGNISFGHGSIHNSPQGDTEGHR